MSIASVEKTILQPFVDILNEASQSVPSIPPPNDDTPIGLTHYTCIPSKDGLSQYECKQGYKKELDLSYCYPTSVSHILIQDKKNALHMVNAEKLCKRAYHDFDEKKYWTCKATTESEPIHCIPGRFTTSLEEGKVNYISVPTYMPNHERYIQWRWPTMRIVSEYSNSERMRDLNPSNSKT